MGSGGGDGSGHEATPHAAAALGRISIQID